MKNTYQLHQFIHKLSKSEKRAISLYIQRYNSVKNQKSKSLFDLINKMEIYDEQKLLSISTKRTLSYDLHKLHKLLIDALSGLHFKSDSDSPGEIINCIELGIKYELPDLIESSLKRGYAIADKTDNMGFRLHLSYYKQKYEKFEKTKKKADKLIEIYRKDIDAAESFIEKTRYKQVWGEVLKWYTVNWKKSSPEVLTFSSDILSELFFENDETDFELEQGNYYFLARAMYFELNNDFENEVQNEEKNLALLLENIEKIESHRISIIYFNLVRSYLSILDFEKAEEKLRGFEAFSKNSNDNELNKKRIQYIFFYTSLIFNHVKGDAEAITQNEDKVDELIKNNKERLNNYLSPDKMESVFLIVVFAFLRQKNHSKCLEWIFKAKNETNAEAFLIEYKFLEFFCHLELDNRRILNSLLNSIDYFISSKGENQDYKELYRIAKAIYNYQAFEIGFEDEKISSPFSFINVLLPYLNEKKDRKFMNNKRAEPLV